MSLSNHSRIVLKVFELLGIEPPKVTHEFRVFAAQALHDMGVSLEVSCNVQQNSMMTAARSCHSIVLLELQRRHHACDMLLGVEQLGTILPLNKHSDTAATAAAVAVLLSLLLLLLLLHAGDSAH